jgi:hypothetical protein
MIYEGNHFGFNRVIVTDVIYHPLTFALIFLGLFLRKN